MERRGNHPHRQLNIERNSDIKEEGTKQKDDDVVDDDDDEIVTAQYLTSLGLRMSINSVTGQACLGIGYSNDVRGKFINGILTKKELRDFIKLRDEREVVEECKILWNNDGPYCKRYDPRIDVTPPKPHQCINELRWLLMKNDKHLVIGIDDDYLEKRGGEYTIVKPIGQHYVMDVLHEMSIDLKYLISDRFQNNDRITYDSWNFSIDVVITNLLMECFSQYSQNKYHPLHQHGSVMSNICTQQITVMNNLLLLFKYHDDGGISYEEMSLDTLCKHIIDTTTPSLKSIAMKTRSNIIIIQGGYYSKLHAVRIATSYPKFTRQRGDAIRHMVNNKCIPSKSALDKLLTMKEKGQIIVCDEWNTNSGGKARPAILLKNERFQAAVKHMLQPSRAEVRAKRRKMNEHDRIQDIREEKRKKREQPSEDQPSWDIQLANLKSQLRDELPELRLSGVIPELVLSEEIKRREIQQHNKEIRAKMNKLWKEELEEQQKIDKYKQQYKQIRSLVLALHPIEMKSDGAEHYTVYQFQSEPNITTVLYAPPKLIDVCNELGLSGKRLYFSPLQFPVTNVETAGDNEVFQQLKDYIVEQSSKAGNSPVVFHSTQPGCKRFVCKYSLKNGWEDKFGKAPFIRCKFSFSVKWDQYGYYIHISKPNPTFSDHSMIRRECVVGCEFHSH